MKTASKIGQRGKLILYISIMAIPVIQFILFYILVNANSILLSFKKFDVVDGAYVQVFVGFENISKVISDLFTTESFLNMIKNSLLFYGVSVIGGTVLSLAFSYYIYKKGFGGNFFKTMLFLPNIVSTMVIAIMYSEFGMYGFPEIMQSVFGVDVEYFHKLQDSAIYYLIFFNLLTSFGPNVLIYTGTMSGISDSVIEAAQIDGVNAWQEFFHIVLPSIFSTFALFIITGMVTIFNGQANLFSFYGLEKGSEKFQTLGFYIYREVASSGINATNHPYLAALGMVLTFIAIPLVFTGRWLLNKYGPKEN